MTHKKLLSFDGPMYTLFDYDTIYIIKKREDVLGMKHPTTNMFDPYSDCTYKDMVYYSNTSHNEYKILAFKSKDDAEIFCKNHLIDYTQIDEMSNISINMFYLITEAHVLIKDYCKLYK